MDMRRDLVITPEHESKSGKDETLLLPGMKKILPFWGAAVLAAIGGIVLLHYHSVRLINYIEYPDMNPLVLAESYHQEGEKLFRIVARQYDQLKNDPARSGKIKNMPEFQKAKSLFLECLKLKPNKKGVYQFLSDLATFEGDLPSMYVYQGKRALSENELNAALEAFDQALILKKDFQPAWEMKITTLIQKQETAKVQESLNKLFEQFSTPGKQPDAQSYYLLAQGAALQKKDKEYQSALEQAVRLDPMHTRAVRDIAGLWSSQGDYDRAIRLLEKTLSHVPRDAQLLHLLGKVFLMKGDYSHARESLESALKVEKYSAPLYFDLAKVYEKLGKKSHSTAMLQKAIEIDPRFKNRILFPDQK